jgi:hypothetical protein
MNGVIYTPPSSNIVRSVFAYSLSATEQKIVVGGQFDISFIYDTTTYNFEIPSHNVILMTIASATPPVPQISKLDSEIPELDTTVYAIAYYNNIVYVGGTFVNLIVNGTTVQTLSYVAYFDLVKYLWFSINNFIATPPNSRLGVDNYVLTIKQKGTNILVGGYLDYIGGLRFQGIALYNPSASALTNPWTQLLSATGSQPGVTAPPVRDIVIVSNTAYAVGDFQAINSSSIPARRVVFINSSNQLVPLNNVSNTRQGFDNPIYSVSYISPNIFFGGTFTNTAATTKSPAPLRLGYYDTTATLSSVTLTGSFLNTEDGTNYSQIVIPTRYKNIYIIYNTSLGRWLVTYRSTGVTFS